MSLKKLKIFVVAIFVLALMVNVGCKKNEEVAEPVPPDISFQTCLVNPTAVMERQQAILYPVVNNPSGVVIRIDVIRDIGYVTPMFVSFIVGTWPFTFTAPSFLPTLPESLTEMTANITFNMTGKDEWQGHLFDTIAAQIIIYRNEETGEPMIMKIFIFHKGKKWEAKAMSKEMLDGLVSET